MNSPRNASQKDNGDAGHINGFVQDCSISIVKQWLKAKLQYLQCVSNGDTAVLQ